MQELQVNVKQAEVEIIDREVFEQGINHDRQNEALIRLTTEIANLSDKVEKIDNKLEELS